MSQSSINFSTILISACGVICIATMVQAQYNTFDSDSNTDSNGSPILTQSELRKLAARQAAMANAASSPSEQSNIGHGNGFYPSGKQARSQMRKRNGFDEASAFAGQSFGQDGSDASGLAGLMRQENARRRKMQMAAANSYDDDGEGAAIGPNFDEDADFNSRPGLGGALNQAASGSFDGGNDGDFAEGGSPNSGFGLDAGSSEHEGSPFGAGGYEASGFDAAGLAAKSSYRQPHNLGLEESSALGYGPSSMGSGAHSSEGGRSSFSSDSADDEGEAEGEDD